MRINKWIVGPIAAGMLVSGVLVAAPSANAELCGYPPVECPVGTTNPPEEQRVGSTPAARAQAGMTLPAQETAAETPPTRPPAPPAQNAIGEAPRTEAQRGDVVRLRPEVAASTRYRVLVKRESGPYNFIGIVTASANGNVVLPAVQFDRRGTYTFALQDGTGTTLYVRVVVS